MESQRTGSRPAHPRFRRRISLFGAVFVSAGSLAAGFAPRARPVEAASGFVGGSVYRDANGNGVADPNEKGVPRVLIQVDGQLSGADAIAGTPDDTVDGPHIFVTNASGVWTSSPTSISSDTKVRVWVRGLDLNGDFALSPGEETLPSELTFGPSAAASPNGISFVDPGTTGIVTSLLGTQDICVSNPEVVAACFIFGSETAYPGSIRQGNASVASSGEVGSVYGTAVSRDGWIYASSYTKRHTADVTPNATIWRLNPTLGVSPQVHVTLPDALPVHDTSNFNLDLAVADRVGKVGIGDLDISEDENSLWWVNMSTGTVARSGINRSGVQPAAGSTQSWVIPVPASCLDPRPFGLGHHDGLVYVGGVCSAESTVTGTDTGNVGALDAYVYAFNPGPPRLGPGSVVIAPDSFSALPVLRFDLDYQRKGRYHLGHPSDSGVWNAWGSPEDMSQDPGRRYQPMLADIAFHDGGMFVGLRDRFGDQTRAYGKKYPGGQNGNKDTGRSYGDVLYACPVPSGYLIEGNGTCGTRTASTSNSGFSGVGNLEGPGGGEVFTADDWFDPSTDRGWSDVLNGSLVVRGDDLWAGSSQADTWYDQGVKHFNAATGSLLDTTQLQGSVESGQPMYDPLWGDFLFGQANGIGDIEVLCGLGPIEFGDRLWLDTDADGAQDPGEPGIANMNVYLFDGPTNLATVQTGADGRFLFSSRPPAAFGSWAATALSLTANKTYTIAISKAAAGLRNLVPTVSLATTPDLDSDLQDLSPNYWATTVRTATAGNLRFDADIGMRQGWAIGNRIWRDANGNDVRDAGDSGVSGVVVELRDATSLAPVDVEPVTPGVQSTTTSDADGYYRFTDLVPGNYRVTVVAANFLVGGPLAGLAAVLRQAGAQTDADSDGIPTGLELTWGISTDERVGVDLSGLSTRSPVDEPLLEPDITPVTFPASPDAFTNDAIDFGFATIVVPTTTSSTTSTTTTLAPTTTTLVPAPTTTTLVPAPTTTTLVAAPTTTTLVPAPTTTT